MLFTNTYLWAWGCMGVHDEIFAKSRWPRWKVAVSVGIAVVSLAGALLQTNVASATPSRWSVVASPIVGRPRILSERFPV